MRKLVATGNKLCYSEKRVVLPQNRGILQKMKRYLEELSWKINTREAISAER